MQEKSILIGSNGYLGRHLALQLQATGIANSNFDIQSEAYPGVTNYHQFNILKEEDFDKLDSDVDYIFLFAGVTGTEAGFDKYREFIDVNEVGVLNLLEWMRKTDCRARVIFPSSRLVYKGSESPLNEDSPQEAKTIYAANKLNAENMLWMYQNAFGIDYTIFRICVPYGNALGGDFSYGTIGFFLRQATKGKNISIFGDGEFRRTFTHVSDITNLMIKSIRQDESRNEIFLIGGEDMSLLDAAKLVARKYGVEVRFVDWPDMAFRLESGSTVFDDSKLRGIISCDFSYTLDSWLE